MKKSIIFGVIILSSITLCLGVSVWAGMEDVLRKQKEAEQRKNKEVSKEVSRDARFNEAVSIIESTIDELSKRGISFESYSNDIHSVGGQEYVWSPLVTNNGQPVESPLIDSRLNNKLIVVEEPFLGKQIYFHTKHGKHITVSIDFYKNYTWEIKIQIQGQSLKDTNKVKFYSYMNEKELKDKQATIKSKILKLVEDSI